MQEVDSRWRQQRVYEACTYARVDARRRGKKVLFFFSQWEACTLFGGGIRACYMTPDLSDKREEAGDFRAKIFRCEVTVFFTKIVIILPLGLEL